MLAHEGGAEVTCEFCRKEYHLDAAALDALIVLASDQSGH